MTPVVVSNLALSEVGSRVLINKFTDNTPQAICANLNYTPRVQAVLRTANWDFVRAQQVLTLWKAAVINGQPSSNPPPQPWLFSYLWPSDCLKARFIMPTRPVAAPGIPLTTAPTPIAYPPPVPTGIPFVPGTDMDANGNPIRVILTNLPNAQLAYTRDLSQVPDTWDSLFLNAATAFLGCYFINALARNKPQYDDQVALSRSLIDQARAANANEGIASVDHTPDWMAARNTSGINWGWNQAGAPVGYGALGGWDSVTYPCGLRF